MEVEPFELDEPPPKGKLPEPKGEFPDDGNVVVGVDPPAELVRQAALPIPNPAAMAINTTSTTAVIVWPQRRLGCDGGDWAQYCPGG